MTERPSIDLVRRATDERVLDALIAHGTLTRPELADRAEVSKPTVSQSIRRLVDCAVVVEDGRTSGGPGRSSLRYRISDRAGLAVALHAGPGELVAEAVDAGRRVLRQVVHPVGLTITPDELSSGLRALVEEVDVDGPVVASIADPVDRRGRTVDLAGSPFVLGSCDVRAVLGDGAVIDNDVNWAALAEVSPSQADSFFYCYLGAGLGAAVVERGQVLRGSTGLAGELAYASTIGAGGRGLRLLDCFAELDLMVAGTTAIDVGAVQKVLTGESAQGDGLLHALGGVLGSAAAVLGHDEVVIGGPWAQADDLLPRLADASGKVAPWPLRLRLATQHERAPLTGAKSAAGLRARAALLALIA